MCRQNIGNILSANVLYRSVLTYAPHPSRLAVTLRDRADPNIMANSVWQAMGVGMSFKQLGNL